MNLLEEHREKDKNSYAIIGACMEVHAVLGVGFTEKVYQDALEIELRHRGISFEREPIMKIVYKQEELQHVFQPDFICCESYVIELKAVQQLTDLNRAQIINYLHATNLKYGILVNFGETSLKFERYSN